MDKIQYLGYDKITSGKDWDEIQTDGRVWDKIIISHRYSAIKIKFVSGIRIELRPGKLCLHQQQSVFYNIKISPSSFTPPHTTNSVTSQICE